MTHHSKQRQIEYNMLIPARMDEVWDAWTTEEGVKSFFAPDCRVEPRPGGPYEMFFDLEAEPGSRGGEGMIFLALQPKTMLSFTWNAPPHLPKARAQMTHVTVRLEETAEGQTSVSLVHNGWGTGGEWDAAFDYFERAWGKIVLPRLHYRFSVGPIDWRQPPPVEA